MQLEPFLRRRRANKPFGVSAQVKTLTAPVSRRKKRNRYLDQTAERAL
jgi:hypothetical protein